MLGEDSMQGRMAVTEGLEVYVKKDAEDKGEEAVCMQVGSAGLGKILKVDMAYLCSSVSCSMSPIF